MASYWERFSEAERAIIVEPETHYTGIAAAKAQAIASYWKNILKKG
jgi:hypothetical protein